MILAICLVVQAVAAMRVLSVLFVTMHTKVVHGQPPASREEIVSLILLRMKWGIRLVLIIPFHLKVREQG